jgi:hypothetical protein
MNKEAKIRDYLVKNLHLMEEGLQPIKTEFKLPNSFGSDGSIDIIAKDTFDLLVMIEIKTSNSSAKNALHQLNKYVGLIRQKLEIPYKTLRTIIISTDWHELILPFSEFVRTVDYPVYGYTLFLNSEDTPYKTEKVNLTPVIEENNIAIRFDF